MRRAVFRLGLLAAATSLPTIAAEVNHSWEKLAESVKVGKSVVVKRTNSVQVEGKLLAIGADSITVRWKGEPEVISRGDVFRVRYANIRRGQTLIMMGICAVVLGAFGHAAGEDNPHTTALSATMGAGIGAAIGGAMPIGKPLYEASGGLKK